MVAGWAFDTRSRDVKNWLLTTLHITVTFTKTTGNPSMTDHQPLTLERWAALDQAASPGPWIVGYASELSWPNRMERPVFRLETGVDCSELGCEEDAKFCAASRQAPTRLLAALRGLADRWERSIPQFDLSESEQQREICADQLRHLIATLDLSQPPPEVQR